MSQQQEKIFIEPREEKDKEKFDALNAWLSLSKEVQEDFRKRGITKKDLEDAIAWARKNGRKR